jgi:preprotein translocase subunit SecG
MRDLFGEQMTGVRAMCQEKTNRNGAANAMVRVTVALTCASFVAALLLSAAFIALRAQHEHDHHGENGVCTTCAHIALAENLLKTVSMAALVTACAIGLLGWKPYLPKVARSCADAYTLISLKVRINN